MNPFEVFDIEEWLASRSTDRQLADGEIVFSHKDGSTSVLIPKEEGEETDGFLASSPLAWFYERYVGASIGNSHVMLASSRKAGVKISQGFVLPDREKMVATLEDLEVVGEENELLFGVEAAWMFAYGIQDGRLIRHDRDMGESEGVESLESVFQDWWNLVCEDE
jgi:hypothetical protein